MDDPSQRRPCHQRLARNQFPLAISCLMACAATWSLIQLAHADGGPGKAHRQVVQIVIDYGNGVRKHYTRIGWRHEMTVLDAMNRAKELRPGLAFGSPGSGPTAIITQIDGIRNEGGGSGKRNWLYWVNDGFADAGIGAKRLDVGDVVIWRFDTYPGQP